jgi:hypothetical protein
MRDGDGGAGNRVAAPFHVQRHSRRHEPRVLLWATSRSGRHHSRFSAKRKRSASRTRRLLRNEGRSTLTRALGFCFGPAKRRAGDQDRRRPGRPTTVGDRVLPQPATSAVDGSRVLLLCPWGHEPKDRADYRVGAQAVILPASARRLPPAEGSSEIHAGARLSAEGAPAPSGDRDLLCPPHACSHPRAGARSGGYRGNGSNGVRSPTDQRCPNGSVKPPWR